MAVVFTAVAVGFAYAMPAIVNTAARVPTQLEPVATPSASTHTQTATVPPVEEEEGDKEHPENHGAAVSTAAHCPVKGRAHGELVRSIAQDKDATVADAEAACAAALAAAAAEPAKEKGKPDKAARIRPTKPPKPSKDTVTDETEVEVEDDSEVEDEDAGGPGNGKGRGKP